MSDNTQPLPVVVWPKGVWHCDLCGQLGAGGAQGFNEHYVGWHWERDEVVEMFEGASNG
jgi:hypothetical protein